MCLCIKITSKAEFGSEVVGFTSNTRDMLLPVGHSGVTFYASPGMTPTIVEQGLDEAATLELTGVYNADSFTQSEVLAGKWAFAEIEVFSVCWNNVNLGELLHFKGNLGEFKDYQTYFTCEGRGLIARLSQEVNEVTQRLCRVDFRGTLCGHAASTVTISAVSYNITHTGVEANVADMERTTVLLYFDGATLTGNVPPTGFFANGKITGESGNLNEGISREIAHSYMDGGDLVIQLKRSFPFVIGTGPDGSYTLVAGCNKTIEDCVKFGNIINRRAEDWIPGLEAANRLPNV